MAKYLPWILAGGAICLSGLASLFLWRKLSYVSSSASSDSIQQALADLESWQKRTELELGSQFDRVQSVLGRLDRAKRTKKDEAASAGGEPAVEAGVDMDQSTLNQILAKRFHSGA